MKQEVNKDNIPRGWHKSATFSESSRHAWSGIVLAFRTEKNLKIQIIVYVLALIGTFLLQVTFAEMAIIILTATLIVSLEMVNTAVEYFSNIVEPQYNDAVRIIKDITAGAVMFASGAAVMIGLLIFLPRIILLLIG
jgi:diacylglycerol kinase